MATNAERSGKSQATELAAGSIGLPQVLFQSAANMSPAGVVAFSLLTGYAYAGSAMPLSMLLVVVAIALISICIGQLAKAMPRCRSPRTVAVSSPPPPAPIGRRAVGSYGSPDPDHRDFSAVFPTSAGASTTSS